MKKAIFTLLLMSTVFLCAQDAQDAKDTAEKVDSKSDSLDLKASNWKKGGTITFLLNQSTFSNWIAGGDDNVAGNAAVNYDFNYAKGDWTWDNKIFLAYGLSKTGNQNTRKSDDRIELNSLLGKKAFGNWSYSFFANFRTQFTDGFDYSLDPEERFETSGLFKPAIVTFGPGFLWKKHDNFKINIAPATSKMVILSSEVYTLTDLDGDGLAYAAGEAVSSDFIETFGIDPGESLRYELGFYASGYYKFNLMKNVSIENILNVYSNYLEDPKNIDLDYTMNAVMQINKYLSTNLTFQAIYDDNIFQGLQTRQIFGLGVNLNL